MGPHLKKDVICALQLNLCASIFGVDHLLPFLCVQMHFQQLQGYDVAASGRA